MIYRFIGLFPLAVFACKPETLPAPQDPIPPFAYHGVIEGFYGTPWSHQDRLDILSFMGQVGLQDYFYAPKADPYHLAQWREPYPADLRRELEELVGAARENGVNLWYAMSPGLTMTYSDSSDYRTLLNKMLDVGSLGVRHFGLFVDDVPTKLSNEADRAAFSSLADAHVALGNKLYRDLAGQGYALALTPTIYTDAWGDTSYVTTLGRGLSPEIPIMWTGTDVASAELGPTHAARWRGLIQRKPLIWDNYPVNDFAPWRLFLGPVHGRAADLGREASGIVANPMNQAHVSMIPLFTLADYVRAPAHYDPERSLDSALVTLYGSEAVPHLRTVVDFFSGDAFTDHAFDALHFLADTIDVGAVTTRLNEIDAAMASLREMAGGRIPLTAFVDETAPVLSAARERIEQLANDPRYEPRGDLLLYRRDEDNIPAPARDDVVVDGRLDEWSGVAWRDLAGRARSAATVSAAQDDNNVYFALRVPTQRADIQSGAKIGEGDHIALVIDAVPDGGGLGPADPIILLRPPEAATTEDHVVTTLTFRGFMTKWLRDNRALRFTEFHLSTFGQPAPSWGDRIRYRARRTPNGYEAEVAIPQQDGRPVHVSLTVTNREAGRRITQSLSRRNYPANPVTFARIVIR